MSSSSNANPPSIFNQVSSILGLNKSKVQKYKEEMREINKSKDPTINGVNIKVSSTIVLHEEKLIGEIISEGSEKCVLMSKKCRYQSRLYKNLNIMLLFLAGFLGSGAGIMASEVNAISGFTVGALSAMCTIFIYVLKWGELSETYASLAIELRNASFSTNPTRDYNIIEKRISTGALNIDLWDDTDQKERCCC